MTRHLNITVFGQVQGVVYRFSAKEIADKLKITGFAKNQEDGTVYIEVEGEQHSLDKFLDWCKKGPKLAQVSEVETKVGELKNFSQFLID